MSDSARKIAVGEASLAAGLFPPGVLTASAPLCGTLADLLPEERRLVDRAVEKRQREFATGRLLARQLLEELGVHGFALRKDAQRVPLWPPGLVGSISHTAKACVAAVARQEDVGGVGIDVEDDGPLEPDLHERLFTEEERSWLQGRSEAERGRLAKLLFVCKEAAYKCTFPVQRRVLGFHDVRISVEPDRRWVSAHIADDAQLTGIFRFVDGVVIAAFTV